MLVALALVARGRKRLLFEEVGAGALAVGLALLAGRIAGTDWSASLQGAGGVGFAAGLCGGAAGGGHRGGRHGLAVLARPLRYVGRAVVGIGALAAIALETAFPIGMVAAFAVGIGSAAIVHLLFGSPAGRLTLDQVADALADLGVEATGLRQAPLEPRGVAIATAEAPDGRSLLVKVYGRDAWDGQLLAAAWTALWYRGNTPHLGAGPPPAGRARGLRHLAGRAGQVSVLPVVAAGMASEQDALLVTEATGRPLDRLDPEEIDDELLADIWGNLGRLHALGVAHRRLDTSRIVVRPDGTPAFGDFGGAGVAADDADLAADRAQVLVATALAVGPQRAAAAALAALGPDALAQVLPLLQPAAVQRQTRHAIGDRDWDLNDLRKACAERPGSSLRNSPSCGGCRCGRSGWWS